MTVEGASKRVTTDTIRCRWPTVVELAYGYQTHNQAPSGRKQSGCTRHPLIEQQRS